MIHLVLDTSIFRATPRLDSPEFKILSHMSNSGQLTLHVPFIVENEFTSQLEMDQRKRLEQSAKQISGALNYGGHGPRTEELGGVLEKLNDDIDALVTERSASFLGWLATHDAVRYQMTLEHSVQAWAEYFRGGPPFKQPKFRKDIPDSLIYQQVVDLNVTFGEELHLVVEDGALGAACSDAGMQVWTSLTEFIASPVAQSVLAQAVIQDNRPEAIETVANIANNCIDQIKDSIEALMLSSEYSELNGDMIPGEFNQVFITGVDRPENIDVENVEYLGDTVFLAQVSGSLSLTYEFSVYLADSFALDEDKFHISPLNDYYVEVETTDEFNFVGEIEFEFPEAVAAATNLDELTVALTNPTVRATSLEDFEVVVDNDQIGAD